MSTGSNRRGVGAPGGAPSGHLGHRHRRSDSATSVNSSSSFRSDDSMSTSGSKIHVLMELAKDVVVNVNNKANKLELLGWLFEGVWQLEKFRLSLASASRKSLENLDNHLDTQTKEVDEAIQSNTLRLAQLEREVSKSVLNQRQCQQRMQIATRDLAHSTEETYDLKKSKEETDDYLEEYRARKRSIEMVKTFVSILLHDGIPDEVHNWSLAGIRQCLGFVTEADLVKHDVNVIVKLMMALNNAKHDQNKELIAHYKANCHKPGWTYGETPILVSAKPRTSSEYDKRKVYQRMAVALAMDPDKVPRLSLNVDSDDSGVAPLGSARSAPSGGFTPTLGSLPENFDDASEAQLEEMQRRLAKSLAEKKRKRNSGGGDSGGGGSSAKRPFGGGGGGGGAGGGATVT